MSAVISVVIPVYEGVDAAEWDRALTGIARQTRQPDEVLVVYDGPVRRDVRRLTESHRESGVPIVVHEGAANRGPGVANQIGLLAAKGQWIAKFDADDLSAPERLQRQLAHVEAEGLDVCGSSLREVDPKTGRLLCVRTAPATHKAAVARMRWNNPVNHPAAFFRRSLALRAGGYPELRFGEDYVLFSRMLALGARFGSIREPLVEFSSGDGLIRRRRSGVVRTEVALHATLIDDGSMSRRRASLTLPCRVAVRSAPPWAVKLVQYRVAGG